MGVNDKGEPEKESEKKPKKENEQIESDTIANQEVLLKREEIENEG